MTTDLKTMEGVIIEKHGGPEVLQYRTDLPVPELEAGEVLVKNEFIGINFIDTYFRSGSYPVHTLPHILGREAFGHIVATGPGGKGDNTFGLRVGDRVVWLGKHGGAYAEYSAVEASHAIKAPDAISAETAGGALFQGLTALTLIREAHRVEAGDWVLVHAAAGGVGLWLCQLLKAVGARTIATASTVEKLALAREHGAEVLVQYTKEDVVARVKEVTGGGGVRAVFDGVGKTTFDVSMQCVARKGSLVTFGNASGPVPPVSIMRLMEKNVKLLRTNLAAYIATREEFEHYANELFEFMAKYKLHARIHKIYPLAEAVQAHQDIESRKTTGKLLLKP